MNSTPGLDGMIEGVIVGLANEVMPYVSNERAVATVAMMQSLLQAVRQILPVYDSCLIDEHNGMTAALRQVAQELALVTGPEADRMRERAATLGQLPDLPAPVDREALTSAHTELGRALESSIADLDVIQRAGDDAATAADAALNAIRAHLAPRYLRDFQLMSVGAGFLGRG